MSEKVSKKPSKNTAQKPADTMHPVCEVNLKELIEQVNRIRPHLFRISFVQGLLFGFGSVIGATILVAIAIWLLGQFGDIFPPLADFINQLTDTMQQRR